MVENKKDLKVVQRLMRYSIYFEDISITFTKRKNFAKNIINKPDQIIY